METLKIIGYVLLVEAVIYYLFTCYHKYNTAAWPEFKDIFNPFKSWREAERWQYFRKGAQSVRDAYNPDLVKSDL